MEGEEGNVAGKQRVMQSGYVRFILFSVFRVVYIMVAHSCKALPLIPVFFPNDNINGIPTIQRRICASARISNQLFEHSRGTDLLLTDLR